MSKNIWLIIAVAAWLLGFLGGYSISSRTGTEPGYFGAVEAAGYGGGSELIEGISEDMQDYYKSLTE
ncbi:MAG: hypothetical protein JSV21_10765 [Nitrospirota bacterium]|nr:MAG: hypothetical protein JSV21_10765 [Nitrospirota bacterium]